MYCDESPGQLAVHKKYRLGKCASVLSPLTVLFTGSPSVARLHKTTVEIEKQNNMTVRALHSQPDGLSILRRHEIRFSK